MIPCTFPSLQRCFYDLGNAFSDLRPERGALRGAHSAQLAAGAAGWSAVRGDPGSGRGRPLFGASRPQIHRHGAVSRFCSISEAGNTSRYKICVLFARFDTSLAGITFEDKLLNIAVGLPTRNLYGLGENYHATFRRVFDDTTWPVFARDELPNTEVLEFLLYIFFWFDEHNLTVLCNASALI